MTDQPSTPPTDPTRPVEEPGEPTGAAAPPVPQPPAASEFPPPAPVAPPAPGPIAPAGSPPPYAAPHYAPPPNPYGGYAAAPPPGAQPPVVAVGSLPYVEHHFGPVATFGDRVVPAIIDGLLNLIGFAVLMVGVFVAAIGGASSATYDAYGNPHYSAGSGVAVGIGVLLIFAGFAAIIGVWVWNRVVRQGRTGQSVGKKMFGLKLIDSTSGQPIGAGNALLRDIVHGVVNQVVYLSYLWMLWDPNRLTLGDMVVKSTVIKVPKV